MFCESGPQLLRVGLAAILVSDLDFVQRAQLVENSVHEVDDHWFALFVPITQFLKHLGSVDWFEFPALHSARSFVQTASRWAPFQFMISANPFGQSLRRRGLHSQPQAVVPLEFAANAPSLRLVDVS